ncbi:hypothetical protein KP509_29G044300 [Ceratopteris richardii]|uniref:Kinesin motor domain-containing protein n=1 Tax=Ceratopteris richardii TaxID=49495 RepID=A0A8T2R7Q7_CERRI|nr:hypothetical protein KP509_29G044300 [Ceratopteris richardii]
MASPSPLTLSNKPRPSSPFRFFKSSSTGTQRTRNLTCSPRVSEPVDPSTSPSLSLNFGGKNQPTVNKSVSGTQQGNRENASLQLTSKVNVTSYSGSGRTIGSHLADGRGDNLKAKECVAVTIRFRPLNTRETQKGDEIAWFPDGDTVVRCEYNYQTAYAFDRVFGPGTTTKQVYDAAAQMVVKGAMEGVNGTVFAYGVTSSGKTHTMHGDQNSPGIIPLAIKDVFNFIQDTPGREYLLRVSYLEIYNEVINDLLNPSQQNLKIREDAQGTYVEGVKEEVVLSPAHALSLIAAGEEHRHVGSNNFNLVSSRSHTIFTLTIESSACSRDGDEEVTFSLLNLIDLAGSESSKTETTGIRRKEGSYINKSLLTLGTVISKLSDGKPTHVPFRDSKLTRLLQSSLSGNGHVSLICTITPASSYFEETHNTLKFAHRAKHVEIHASSNKIMDEKSLIKKYQKEISTLKEELELLKRGMISKDQVASAGNGQEDVVNLCQQLEAGQMKMQSRLEEEEQAKAALLERIQKLTRLILVSSKSSITNSVPDVQLGHRRRHSFGEEESYIMRTKRLLVMSPASSRLECFQKITSSSLMTHNKSQGSISEAKGQDNSHCSAVDGYIAAINALQSSRPGEHFSISGEKSLSTEGDLLREQAKMLAGEVALLSSSLKRMLDHATNNPDDSNLQVQIQKVKDDIQAKKSWIAVLEKRIILAGEAVSLSTKPFEVSQNVTKLMNQLNELTFELEIKSADNRVLQDRLEAKIAENNKLEELTRCLRGQLAALTTEYSQKVDEIKQLKQENTELMEEKAGLQIRIQKVSEEATYARQLASAADLELKRLLEEVTRLSLQNAKLQTELTATQDIAYSQLLTKPIISELQKDVHPRKEREAGLEAALIKKENIEVQLQCKLEEAKQKEVELENDLARMWILISNLEKNGSCLGVKNKKDGFYMDGGFQVPEVEKDIDVDMSHLKIKEAELGSTVDELKAGLELECRRTKEMELLVCQLKGEGLSDLDAAALEDLQNLHVEALDKLCKAKAKIQQKLDDEREKDDSVGSLKSKDDKKRAACKVLFETPTGAIVVSLCRISWPGWKTNCSWFPTCSGKMALYCFIQSIICMMACVFKLHYAGL